MYCSVLTQGSSIQSGTFHSSILRVLDLFNIVFPSTKSFILISRKWTQNTRTNIERKNPHLDLLKWARTSHLVQPQIYLNKTSQLISSMNKTLKVVSRNNYFVVPIQIQSKDRFNFLKYPSFVVRSLIKFFNIDLASFL